MKICITGAAGKLGRKTVEALSSHELTLVDVGYPTGFAPTAGKLQGSITDQKFLEQALRGQDALLHLAVAHENGATSNEARWNVNVQGTLNVVKAALTTQVKKIVYVSSLSVLHGHAGKPGHSGSEEMEPLPITFYGLTKLLGEEIVKYHAHAGKMKSVVLRPMAIVAENDDPAWLAKTAPNFRVSDGNVATACRLAIEKDLPSLYEVFHICGSHPAQEWRDEKARRMLGYQPQENTSERSLA